MNKSRSLITNSKIECQKCKEPLRLFPLASNASRTRSLSMFTFLWMWSNTNPLRRSYVMVVLFHVFSLRKAEKDRLHGTEPTGIVRSMCNIQRTLG